MRFDLATVPLVPRTTLNCLDVAFAFLRQNFAALAGLWALVAVPACVTTYFYVDRLDGNWLIAVVVFLFATVVLGTFVTTGAALCTFGEQFTIGSTLHRLRWLGWRLVAEGALWRLLTVIGLPFGLVPGAYVAVRTGFSVEKRVLSNLGRHLHDRRTSELLKGEIGDLVVRAVSIILFTVLLWVMLVMTIDFASTYLLGYPILWGRLNLDLEYLGGFFAGVGYALGFFWSDPAIVTLGLASAFLAYVPARIAWFFCYIDVRVRRDCWDMELKMLREAERLEAA